MTERRIHTSYKIIIAKAAMIILDNKYRSFCKIGQHQNNSQDHSRSTELFSLIDYKRGTIFSSFFKNLMIIIQASNFNYL